MNHEQNEIHIDPVDLAAIHVVMAMTPDELTWLETLRARIAQVYFPRELLNSPADMLLYALDVIEREDAQVLP